MGLDDLQCLVREGRAVHRDLPAQRQAHTSKHHIHDAAKHRQHGLLFHILPHPFDEHVAVISPLSNHFPRRVGHEPREQREQDHTIDTAQRIALRAVQPVERHERGGKRADGKHGDLARDQRPVHEQRPKQCRRAQQQTGVGDVRPDDVAEPDVILAQERGGEVDDQFGRAGAEGDNGHADDDGGDAKPAGHGHRAAHERITPEQEHHQADDDEQQL